MSYCLLANTQCNTVYGIQEKKVTLLDLCQYFTNGCTDLFQILLTYSTSKSVYNSQFSFSSYWTKFYRFDQDSVKMKPDCCTGFKKTDISIVTFDRLYIANTW